MARATSAPVPAVRGRRTSIARAKTHRMIPVYSHRLPAVAIQYLCLRLVTFERERRAEPGVLFDGHVTGIRGAGFEDTLAVIAGGREALDRVRRWLESAPRGERFDAARTTLCLLYTSPSPRD